MGAPDDSTDPGRVVPTTRTDPDFRVRPAIEGTDPLAEGGWHSSGGTKATVVALEAPPGPAGARAPEPNPGGPKIRSAEIEVTPARGIPMERVIVLLMLASALAFALGRWSS